MTKEEAKEIFKRCINNPNIFNIMPFDDIKEVFLPKIKGECAKPLTSTEAKHLIKALDDDYLSQDELDEVLEKYKTKELLEDEVSSLLAGIDISLDDNKTQKNSDKQVELNLKLRPCERTYYFQGIEFTPDYINELASRNGLLWILKNKKNNGIIFDNDEIYQLIEAVCDNWSRYYESC